MLPFLTGSPCTGTLTLETKKIQMTAKKSSMPSLRWKTPPKVSDQDILEEQKMQEMAEKTVKIEVDIECSFQIKGEDDPAILTISSKPPTTLHIQEEPKINKTSNEIEHTSECQGVDDSCVCSWIKAECQDYFHQCLKSMPKIKIYHLEDGHQKRPDRGPITVEFTKGMMMGKKTYQYQFEEEKFDLQQLLLHILLWYTGSWSIGGQGPENTQFSFNTTMMKEGDISKLLVKRNFKHEKLPKKILTNVQWKITQLPTIKWGDDSQPWYYPEGKEEGTRVPIYTYSSTTTSSSGTVEVHYFLQMIPSTYTGQKQRFAGGSSDSHQFTRKKRRTPSHNQTVRSIRRSGIKLRTLRSSGKKTRHSKKRHLTHHTHRKPRHY